MIFVDASALVSILKRESDAFDLAAKWELDDRIISPIAIWETIAALTKAYSYTVPAARAAVADALNDFAITQVPIGPTEADLAATAYERYGKGRHKAALNMGDCFAYACAKSNNAKLLFKGDDFSQTDVLPA